MIESEKPLGAQRGVAQGQLVQSVTLGFPSVEQLRIMNVYTPF